MLTVTALIPDRVQANHAVQKLHAAGVPPAAVRTIVRDPGAAREWARRGAGDRTASIVTGALVGLLLGGALGWMLGGSIDPLAGPTERAVAGNGPTALVGLAVGLLLGLLLGLLAGTLGQRRQMAAYVDGVAAGDVLLVATIAEDRLRAVETLLGSYGARGVRVLAGTPDLPDTPSAPADEPVSPAAP